MDYYMPEPPRDPRNTSTVIAILLLVFLALYMCSCSTEQAKHKCEWIDCIYYNQAISTIEIPSEEDTDGYLFDLTHIKYPDWTEEQCETYIFSSQSIIEFDYYLSLDKDKVYLINKSSDTIHNEIIDWKLDNTCKLQESIIKDNL